MKLVGTTPVVSRDYDPNCKTSYVVGLIRCMKTNERDSIQFDALANLIVDAGCVDKGVITEMIDWGLNYVADLNDALGVAQLSYDMLLKLNVSNEEKWFTNDTRIAFAIRAGLLLEMCLGFIEQFERNRSWKLKRRRMSVTLRLRMSSLSTLEIFS